MFSGLIINIALWALLWIGSWAFFFLYLQKKVDYIKHYWLTFFYFLGTAILTIVIFREYIVRVTEEFVITPLFFLAAVYLIHVLVYYYFPKYVRPPGEYFQKYQKRTFLLLDFRRLLSKSADLFSQQVFIVLLVLFLKDAGLGMGGIIAAFAVIFGAVHLPIILLDRGAWYSWYFSIFSIASAIVFPLLILKVHYGFVYSFIVHMMFYLLTAMGFWLKYEKSYQR